MMRVVFQCFQNRVNLPPQLFACLCKSSRGLCKTLIIFMLKSCAFWLQKYIHILSNFCTCSCFHTQLVIQSIVLKLKTKAPPPTANWTLRKQHFSRSRLLFQKQLIVRPDSAKIPRWLLELNNNRRLRSSFIQKSGVPPPHPLFALVIRVRARV
jgi:hypothetical protein